jgi:hypothetical protein
MKKKTRRESSEILACKYLHEIPLCALSYEEFGIMSITVRCLNLELNFICITQYTDEKSV